MTRLVSAVSVVTTTRVAAMALFSEITVRLLPIPPHLLPGEMALAGLVVVSQHSRSADESTSGGDLVWTLYEISSVVLDNPRPHVHSPPPP